jgi:hypothetical protein
MLPMLDLQRKSVEFPEAGRIGSWKLEGLEAGSWKDWKLEGTEGHRCGDALGPEDLGIVSLKLRKSGNFFFGFD